MTDYSEDQLNEFRETFSLFDKQNTGAISPDSLGDLFRALGQNPSKSQVDEMAAAYRDAHITYDFFQQTILRQKSFKPTGGMQDFIQGFQIFDKDGSGLIASGELRFVLTSLGEKLTDEEVDELLRCVEVDKNGFVNYENFVKHILSH